MPRKNGYAPGFFVYLMGAEDLLENKIGLSTKSPERRRIEMNVGSPRELFVITWCEVGSLVDVKSLEASLHRQFEPRRLRGEWFNFIHCEEFHRAAKKWPGEIVNRVGDGREAVEFKPRQYKRLLGDARIVDIMPRIIEKPPDFYVWAEPDLPSDAA